MKHTNLIGDKGVDKACFNCVERVVRKMFCSIAIFVHKDHKWYNQKSFIKQRRSNPSFKAKVGSNSKFLTLGAGDEKMFLVSRLNRKKDVSQTKKAMYSLKSSDSIAEKLIKYTLSYQHSGKYVPYNIFPKKGSPYYNSNSFARGLLNAAGLYPNKPGYNVPGWSKPLPASKFR